MPVECGEILLGEGERGLGPEDCCRMAGEEKLDTSSSVRGWKEKMGV